MLASRVSGVGMVTRLSRVQCWGDSHCPRFTEQFKLEICLTTVVVIMAPAKPVAAMDSWIAPGKISKATVFSWAKQLREGSKIQAKNLEALKAFMNFHEV